jgi:hypothetical protein
MAIPSQAAQINPVATSPVVLVDSSGHELEIGSTASSTGINLTGANQQVTLVPTILRCISIAESTETGRAKVRVWDSATGTSSGKTRLGTYTLGPGESREESTPKPALLGVWVEIVSGAAYTGTVEGSILIG